MQQNFFFKFDPKFKFLIKCKDTFFQTFQIKIFYLIFIIKKTLSFQYILKNEWKLNFEANILKITHDIVFKIDFFHRAQ